MNPATAEWVSKAEGDFLTAGRELRARKSPNYDAVCFHAQQCAEKYLKAVLQENVANGDWDSLRGRLFHKDSGQKPARGVSVSNLYL